MDNGLCFELVGGPYGDCTSSYKVTLNDPPKEITVQDFIEKYVLPRTKEWGYIRLGKLYGKSLDWPTPIREYRDGTDFESKYTNDQYWESYKHFYIDMNEIKGHGGYTSMDYTLSIYKESSQIPTKS